VVVGDGVIFYLSVPPVPVFSLTALIIIIIIIIPYALPQHSARWIIIVAATVATGARRRAVAALLARHVAQSHILYCRIRVRRRQRPPIVRARKNNIVYDIVLLWLYTAADDRYSIEYNITIGIVYTPRNIAYDRRSCTPNTVCGITTGKVLRGCVWLILLLGLYGWFSKSRVRRPSSPRARSCTLTIISARYWNLSRRNQHDRFHFGRLLRFRQGVHDRGGVHGVSARSAPEDQQPVKGQYPPSY